MPLALWPTGIVATTLFVRGSIRVTVPSVLSLTHTPPAPTATPSGSVPTGMRRDGPLRPRIQPRDPAARAGDSRRRPPPPRPAARPWVRLRPDRARDAAELRVDHARELRARRPRPRAPLGPTAEPVDGDPGRDGVGDAPRARPIWLTVSSRGWRPRPSRRRPRDRRAVRRPAPGRRRARRRGRGSRRCSSEHSNALLAAGHRERDGGRARDGERRRRGEHRGMPPARRGAPGRGRRSRQHLERR